MAGFGWWSSSQADETGFSIYHGLNGGYLPVSFASSNPDIEPYMESYPDLIYVGAVGERAERIPAPYDGFTAEMFLDIEYDWETPVPPEARRPPRVVRYKKKNNRINISLEL